MTDILQFCIMDTVKVAEALGHFLFLDRLPMPTVEEIEKFIAPVLGEYRFELVEAQYRREGGRWVLRLFIDKLGQSGETLTFRGSKVTLDDCEKVSRIVGDSLDVANLLGSSYVLEVSSPGINRPLKNEAHFKAAIG